MSLTGPQLKKIHVAVVDGYGGDRERLKFAVKTCLEVDFDAHASPAGLDIQIWEFLAWAEVQGKVLEFLHCAWENNSENDKLAKLWEEAAHWTEGRGDPNRPPDLATRAAERAYLESLMARYEARLERYTPLAGTVETVQPAAASLVLQPGVMPREFAKLRDYGYGPQLQSARAGVDDLRKAVATHKRVVLLGESGAGKTATLERLAYDYARSAADDPTAPIPLLVRLGGYDRSEPALAYARQFAGELVPYLAAYCENGRLILLLDALDEMPRTGYDTRRAGLQALLDHYPQVLVVVTCRAPAYHADLSLIEVHVQPLDVFCQRTYLHSYLGETAGEQLFWNLAGEDAADLWQEWQRRGMTFAQFWTAKDIPDELLWSLSGRQRAAWAALHGGELPPLLAVGANPYMLLLLVQVAAGTAPLPRNRGNLLRAFVAVLVERERLRHAAPHPGLELLEDACAALAFTMQQSGNHGTAVDVKWAGGVLSTAGFDASSVLELGAGASLLDITGSQVRFVHPMLQRYFAASAWQARLAGGDDLRQYWPGGWIKPSGWEESMVLLAGIVPHAADLITRLAEIHPPLAARCLAENELAQGEPQTADLVRERLAALAASRNAAVDARVAAGDALNLVDDKRPGVGCTASGEPQIAWVHVPGDTVEIKQGRRPRSFTAGSFHIARYPVTNAQYAAFVRDGGYTARWRKCWDDAGWNWRVNRARSGPTQYGGAFDLPNHPVVGVSWFEAQAFCVWLAERLGCAVCLPNEAQWLLAAQGLDDYVGSAGLGDPRNKNSGDSGLGTTSAVGIFPGSESPGGIMDLLGNVWELVGAGEKIYKGAGPLPAAARTLVRGGSFVDPAETITTGLQASIEPDYVVRNVGFRVVCLTELPQQDLSKINI